MVQDLYRVSDLLWNDVDIIPKRILNHIQPIALWWIEEPREQFRIIEGKRTRQGRKGKDKTEQKNTKKENEVKIIVNGLHMLITQDGN